MRPALIRKSHPDSQSAKMPFDELAEATFSWVEVGRQLGVLPDSPVNIAYLAVDRHAHSALGEKAAFRFLGVDGTSHVVCYRELAGLTDRFANVLRSLNVAKGDFVFVLCERVLELYVAMLGALKIGAVVSPLFQAFGPEPIRTRIAQAGGSVLVTTASTYQRKVEMLRSDLPSLKHVLLVDDIGVGALPGTQDMHALLRLAPETPMMVSTFAEDPALLHFTSGTTGLPKGAIHVHGAVLSHFATARSALDLHSDDVFWCTADPGWVTGTSYGIIAPLVLGVTSIVDEGPFDAVRWIQILRNERVNVWYTAPTAIRMLMKARAELFADQHFPDLRFIASVGEALNPEAVWWGQDVLGRPIHDNWWQTETGCIMIANTAAEDIKPGSMGRPLPGVKAHVVRRRPGNTVEWIDAPDIVGELALEAGWPSMFRAYLDQPARYAECFADKLYLSGDLVRRDAEGYYWFVGRNDDVIKSAGHLIGPIEVENVLMEHPSVAEAAVIGKPNAIAGETIKAFIVLKTDVLPSERLRLALMAHARRRLGAVVAPKEIAFATELPHTRSGKIMRRLLKARELGLPEGDSSTLE
jgi:acetyl-CoA synthetase